MCKLLKMCILNRVTFVFGKLLKKKIGALTYARLALGGSGNCTVSPIYKTMRYLLAHNVGRHKKLVTASLV